MDKKKRYQHARPVRRPAYDQDLTPHDRFNRPLQAYTQKRSLLAFTPYEVPNKRHKLA